MASGPGVASGFLPVLRQRGRSYDLLSSLVGLTKAFAASSVDGNELLLWSMLLVIQFDFIFRASSSADLLISFEIIALEQSLCSSPLLLQKVLIRVPVDRATCKGMRPSLVRKNLLRASPPAT